MTAEINTSVDKSIQVGQLSTQARKTGIEILKFSGVGILNTLLDAALYFSLTRWVGLAAVGAKALSYSAGVLNSYLLNSRYTFQSQTTDGRQVLLFILLNIGMLGINSGIMAFGLRILRLPELLALGAATGASFLVNFWFSKQIVFR